MRGVGLHTVLNGFDLVRIVDSIATVFVHEEGDEDAIDREVLPFGDVPREQDLRERRNSAVHGRVRVFNEPMWTLGFSD